MSIFSTILSKISSNFESASDFRAPLFTFCIFLLLLYLEKYWLHSPMFFKTMIFFLEELRHSHLTPDLSSLEMTFIYWVVAWWEVLHDIGELSVTHCKASVCECFVLSCVWRWRWKPQLATITLLAGSWFSPQEPSWSGWGTSWLIDWLLLPKSGQRYSASTTVERECRKPESSKMWS